MGVVSEGAIVLLEVACSGCYGTLANKYFRDHEGDAWFADGDPLLINSIPAEIPAQLSPKAAFKHIIVNPKKSK